jgi:hypothetical protein
VSRSPLLGALVAAALLAPATSGAAVRDFESAWTTPIAPTTFLVRDFSRAEVRLPNDLDLLRRFAEPWVERPGEWRSFLTGRYGPKGYGHDLVWSDTSCEPTAEELPDLLPALGLAELQSTTTSLLGFDTIPLWTLDRAPAPDISFTERKACKAWERPHSVTVARYGAEVGTFRILECDGSVALDALDQLSVLARPPGTARPELPLPLEPEPASEAMGEWVPNVRLLHPRLLWVLARVSQSFPGRPIYLVSGYRRDTHGSLHRQGRALDLQVIGVAKEDVFRVCRRIKDAGCGYYPNNNFIHVDVRGPNTGHALWVDDSKPGHASHYVDSWPGVVSGGALSFAAEP